MRHTAIDYIEEDIDNLPANISQQMHIIGNTFFLATNNIRGLCEHTKQTQLNNYIYNLMNNGTKDGFYPILMGDFNTDLIKYNDTYVQQNHVPWKFLLTKYLTDTNYIETYSLFHDTNVPTWNRISLSACLDQICISPSLQMDLLHADILLSLIYDTDHKIVIAQFITSGIFSMPTCSNDKRNKSKAPSRYLYNNID